MELKKIKKFDINGITYDLGGLSNVVDNLETADSQSALSANQGKVLNEKVETIKMESVVGNYNKDTGTMKLQFTTPVQGIVEDTLESDNTDNALSAKQGKVLNEKIDILNNSIPYLVHPSQYPITMESESFVATVASFLEQKGITSYTEEDVCAVIPVGARKSGSSILYPAIFDGTYIRCHAEAGAVLFVYIFHKINYFVN